MITKRPFVRDASGVWRRQRPPVALGPRPPSPMAQDRPPPGAEGRLPHGIHRRPASGRPPGPGPDLQQRENAYGGDRDGDQRDPAQRRIAPG
jgi:hypothetical protein